MKALANCMDIVSTEGRWGVRWSWQSAERLFKKLAARLKDEDRRGVIEDVFAHAKSIGWLMSELIRDELRAHGRVGERTQSEGERLLSEDELNEAIALLHDRFRSIDRENLLNAPDLLSLMYEWMESGDEDGVLQWVREQEDTDQNSWHCYPLAVDGCNLTKSTIR